MEDAIRKDDSELIERCISRDPAAWDSFVRKYSGLVHAAIDNRARIYRSPLPRHDIEDIKQDVLSSIWERGKLLSVKNRKDVSCWLAIVSGNAAVEHLRKRRDEEPLSEDGPMGLAAPVPRDEEIARGLELAMEKMGPREKLVMQLHLLYDKKYREISDILDIPMGTVSSCIKRAKTRLRKRLKDLRK